MLDLSDNFLSSSGFSSFLFDENVCFLSSFRLYSSSFLSLVFFMMLFSYAFILLLTDFFSLEGVFIILSVECMVFFFTGVLRPGVEALLDVEGWC